MKVENRAVYIADDGEEFDSEEMCKRHETINFLTLKFCEMAGVDSYYASPIATVLFDYFDVIKQIMGEE